VEADFVLPIGEIGPKLVELATGGIMRASR